METKMMMKNRRIPHIDALKVLGLLLIILAHVSPPQILFHVRTFDVPMMVVLAGYLGFFSYRRHHASGGKAGRFIWKRFVRIAVPTWIFTFCLYVPIHALRGNEYTFSELVKIFLFQREPMGYIWIALVYILSAVALPISFNLGVNKAKTFCIFIGAYIVYEILVAFEIGTENALISSTIYQIIPYGLLTLIGMNLACGEKCIAKKIAIVAGILFTVLLLSNLLIKNEILSPQSAKYPATLYYLSYGVTATMILFLFFEKKPMRLFQWRLIQFISSSSYWIYLWHIMYIAVCAKLLPYAAWYFRFGIIFLCSIGTVWVQHRCIMWLREHTKIPNAVLSVFEG